jgi:hypothetical protein
MQGDNSRESVSESVRLVCFQRYIFMKLAEYRQRLPKALQFQTLIRETLGFALVISNEQ